MSIRFSTEEITELEDAGTLEGVEDETAEEEAEDSADETASDDFSWLDETATELAAEEGAAELSFEEGETELGKTMEDELPWQLAKVKLSSIDVANRTILFFIKTSCVAKPYGLPSNRIIKCNCNRLQGKKQTNLYKKAPYYKRVLECENIFDFRPFLYRNGNSHPSLGTRCKSAFQVAKLL